MYVYKSLLLSDKSDCNQMTLFISFILAFGYELVTYRNLQEDSEVLALGCSSEVSWS